MRLWAKFDKQGTWDGIRKVGRETWIKKLPEDLRAFLFTLPLVHRPQAGILMVHGGFFPKFFEHHGEIGEVPTDWHKGGGKKMERMRRFLRIRDVNAEGNMLGSMQSDSTATPWGDTWDGREGFVFFGHAPQKGGVKRHEHAMGVDTGAVFGNRLSAAVVSPGEDPRQAEIISVPGRKVADWLE